MNQVSNPTTAPDMNNLLKVRIRELSILHEIARAVTSTLDLQSVLNRIVEAAVYLTNAEEGFIMLADEDSNQLYLRAGKGLGDKAAKVMSMQVTDTLAGEVIKTGKPLRMGGQQKSDSYKVKTGYLVKSILNVPIKTPHRVLGVLSVDHAIESFKTFSDHDISLLTRLSEYAAIAIENAQRYEQASSRAEELAKALEIVDVDPKIPSRESDRAALEKFNRGLKNQHEEVEKARQKIDTLAQDLRAKADTVDELARRLGVWNEEVDNLIPQLDWIAQTGLARSGTGPLSELPSSDSEIIATFNSLLAHISDGILLCDRKGKILDVSPVALSILNRPIEDIVGKTLSILADKDIRWEHLVSSLHVALALGKESSAKTPPPPSSATLYLGEKIIKVTLVSTSKMRSNNVAIIAALKDISAEMRGWHARDEALAGISESLRTPMAAIASYSDLLATESVGLITRAQRNYLDRIRQAVDKIEEELNRYTSIPRHVPPTEQTDQTKLIQTLKESVKTIQSQAEASNINLVFNAPPSLPPIQMHPEQFAKIIRDLGEIACAHTLQNESLELTIKVQEENSQPAYVVVIISNPEPHSNASNGLGQDPNLQTIIKAVEYQGGRIWTDIDFAGRWDISFLIPTAI